MADLGFLSTIGVSVGQTLPFSLAIPGVHQVSYPQQASGKHDTLIINNLSACTFQVTLLPTGRSFTLPAGVPTNPLPLGLTGVYDDQVSLFVENISSGSFANQVHFDWFSANEPMLYVGSTATSTGSISLTAITASSITIPSPDNWVIAQDGSGDLTLSNTTTGFSALFTPTAGLTTHDTVFSSTALSTGGDIFSTGPYAQVGGQNTVGSFGVAPIVAQKLAQNVVATGLTTILTYTPTTDCYLRLNGMVDIGDTTPEKQVFQVVYTPQHGAGATKNFTAVAGTTVVPLDGATNGALASGNHACQPLDITCKASTTVTISYNNPGGTVNDFVTAIIERLG